MLSSFIGKHINNVLKKELSEDNSVVANFATTAADGTTYKVGHYNLDVIIPIGYRAKSQRGVEFRKSAKKRIPAAVFLYFLDDEKAIANQTLLALTIMIAKSQPAEKENNYMVFYVIHEETKTVSVIRFQHSRRDWISLLQNDV